MLPFASTISGIVNFGFGMVPLLALLILVYPSHLSWTILLIPVIAIVQFVFTMALAIVLSALNVFYRDIGNLAKHVLRLWFYLSPALYSADRVAELTTNHRVLGSIYGLNPWSVLFEAYHDVIYYGTAPSWTTLGVLTLVSCGLVAITVVLFKRVEPAFAKAL